MKHNLRCIGRLVRIRNGKLVTQRKVYERVDLELEQVINSAKRISQRYARVFEALFDDDPKALERWQQRKWNEPSELKVDHVDDFNLSP